MRKTTECTESENRHKWIRKDPGRKRGKTVFLDRDGVIVDDVHYLRSIDDIQIRPGLQSFLKYTKSNGYLNVVVTNQSGIRRGLYTWGEYEKINQAIMDKSDTEEYIDGIYANDGLRVENKRSWRKPGIGMIRSAEIDLGADVLESIMVGDRLTDLLCAANAGIQNLYYMQPSHSSDKGKDMHEYLREACEINIREVRIRKVDSLEEILEDIQERSGKN